MSLRFGVDVGGTFSDLIVYDPETRRLTAGKVLSTPSAPEEGVLAVVSTAMSSPELARAEFLLHGTTVGLNALLERRGPALAMLTTRGFRDVIELRRADRLATYDPTWKAEQPLVRRRLRLPVTERIRANGDVEQELDPRDVVDAFALLERAGVESIAIAFINAYANPAHELEARNLLLELGFEGDISMSHAVSGEFREYERTSTTVIDAYVRPRIVRYLQNLEGALADAGFRGTGLVTRCGGGSLTFAEAERRPFETIMSGPVAGVVGAAVVARTLDLPIAITADVGGTSFDTSLIIDGQPRVQHEGEIASLPIQTSWVDVRSIGAGGGSIAFADSGLLRVGPRSAGASPGPVCYGRGGSEPTVTDAAVVLGMIPSGDLAGGIRLDREAALRACERVGGELKLSPTETARGVLRIASAAMADAIRSVSVAQGHDPREAALIAFGGAGPLFGTLLAVELAIQKVIVPNHPGNFSAWGLLNQDLAQSASATTVHRLNESGIAAANSALANLRAALRARSDSRLDALEASEEAALDVRYRGQEYTLTTPIELGASGEIVQSAEDVARDFQSIYKHTFGHTLDDEIEIVTVRATRRRLLPPLTAFDPDADSEPPLSEARVEAFSFTADAFVSFDVCRRSALQASAAIAGPIIVVEPTSTTFVDLGFAASLLSDRSLAIERVEDQPARVEGATGA